MSPHSFETLSSRKGIQGLRESANLSTGSELKAVVL